MQFNTKIEEAIKIQCPLPLPGKSFAHLKKITITPTRIIFGEHVVVAKNRVLRQFPEEDTFILVDFTDEEYQSLCGGDNFLMHRMHSILVHSLFFFLPYFLIKKYQLTGLVLHGKRYNFTFGNPRKGSCWFSIHEVKELNLGDFSGLFCNVSLSLLFFNFTNEGIKNPGKLLARRALAFASSTPTITLPQPISKQNIKPDITGTNWRNWFME